MNTFAINGAAINGSSSVPATLKTGSDGFGFADAVSSLAASIGAADVFAAGESATLAASLALVDAFGFADLAAVNGFTTIATADSFGFGDSAIIARPVPSQIFASVVELTGQPNNSRARIVPL
jgi:hypothetical protein